LDKLDAIRFVNSYAKPVESDEEIPDESTPLVGPESPVPSLPVNGGIPATGGESVPPAAVVLLLLSSFSCAALIVFRKQQDGKQG